MKNNPYSIIKMKFKFKFKFKLAHKIAGPGAAAPGGFGRSPRFCRCCKAELIKDIFSLLKKYLGQFLSYQEDKTPAFWGFILLVTLFTY
jgi:hypothetical protein